MTSLPLSDQLSRVRAGYEDGTPGSLRVAGNLRVAAARCAGAVSGLMGNLRVAAARCAGAVSGLMGNLRVAAARCAGAVSGSMGNRCVAAARFAGAVSGLMDNRRVALGVWAAVLVALACLPGMAASTHSGRGVNPENARLLMSLDSLLNRREEFVKVKEAHLSELRSTYNRTQDPVRKYWLANDLYEEYCAYDSDSAMHYVDEAMRYARQMDRQDLIDEMRLNKSYIYSATGLLNEADEILSGMDAEKLSDPLAIKYCDRQLFLSTHRDQYMGVERETSLYSAKMDSLLQEARKHVTKENPHYTWLIGWSSLTSKEESAKAIPMIDSIVNANGFNTRGNAMEAWVLAKLYERVGDRDNYLKYMIKSAMADIRASNKEISSLEEITKTLYEEGDYEHANTYLNYCIVWANEYKSRVRIGRLAEIQRQTLGAINEQVQKKTEQVRLFLWILCFVLLVLAFAVFYILKQNHKLHKSRIALSDANDQLSKRVVELQKAREELNEANRELNEANRKLSESYETIRHTAEELSEINDSKEEYIANIFTICSNYISSHEEFRANLHRLLSNRKFEQAVQLVKSPELSYEEIKELYANFDKIFLQIYPDFVADFNTLLKAEEQIELKNPERLTTELRIYALVRLGLNDSVKIARFLHCSVQTVYNTRQRTRNKAAVPREEFAMRVQALGKPTL